MIPILDESSWREFRGAPKKRGLNQTTHQALIADQQGVEHKCFVKICPTQYPTPFTEAFAYLVAEALELPRPKFAALVFVPIQKLSMAMPLDQHWLAHSTALAFCASAVPGKHITSNWSFLAHFRAARAFKHNDVARIAAFDMWLENQDRHTGNLMRSKDGGYVPIDNELILYSIAWLNSGVRYVHNSLLKRAEEVLSAEAYKRFVVDIATASRSHEDALHAALPGLQRCISTMVADKASAARLDAQVMQFLKTRAHPHWLANELGCIV